MKNGELYNFLDGVSKVNLSGSKFTYIISKNKEMAERFVRELEKLKKPVEEYQDYLEAIEKTKQKYAKKKANGKFILLDKELPGGGIGKFYDLPGIDDEESEVRKELSEVETKFENAKKKQWDQERKFVEETLEQESEFKPRLIRLSDVPREITQVEMDIIHWMITEDEA